MKSLLLILFLMISATEAFAQGKIVGKVVDKTTQEPLLGVNVILLGTYIGAATDLEGDYIIVNVPVGVYSIQASMVGATKITKTDVVVSSGQTTRVDFELEEATTTLGQEIVITAQRNILHKEVSSSQIVINDSQIKEAAGVRTLQDFLSTQAGITGKQYLTIREGLPNETGTLVNGLTFVDARSGQTQSLIPTSSIEQVSLKAGGMSAEYGDFRSGIINVTTKSGTSDGYHGTVNFTNTSAQMKRFGRSLYDPMNNYLRAHLDPDIAFMGVADAVTQGIISDYEKQQLGQQSFKGWKFWSGTLPATWRTGLKPGQKVTPVDLYLYDAWMHMVNPDFNKLNAKIKELNDKGLNVGSEITDENLKNLFAKHANKEGQFGDFNFDGGFGGPVPLVGKALGDATFYLSNVTQRTSYIQPVYLKNDVRSNTMLALKSNITRAITLKLTASYTFAHGMSPARGADDELPSLGNTLNTGTTQGLDRGSFMPENNIPLFTNSGSGFNSVYWWYPTMLQDWTQKDLLLGGNLTHALSATTFYDLSVSYQRTTDKIDGQNVRDTTVLAHLGPIPVNEMPYGRQILPVEAGTYTLDGWTFDNYYTVPGLSERFDSKGGVVTDNSVTQQFRIKLNFGSQISKMHFIKLGLEYFKMDLNNNRWAYWPYQNYLSAYEYNVKVKPSQFGAYIQDEITFEDMVANVGIRMDYYSSGDLKWPTGQPFNTQAFGPAPPDSNWLNVLRSGGSVVWQRWEAVDAAARAAGQTPLLQPVDDHIVFSPRFGISFPITDRAKFYFNYGHFNQLPPFSEMYMYNLRWDKQGTFNLGNPNLAPARTIQYELGVDYNLLDMYLIHIAGYYKDVTGEVRSLRYNDNSGLLNYNFRTNDRYRDIQGLEIQVTKATGDILTGWVNLKYTYASGGNTGRILVSENPATNDAISSFYNQDPTRPTPVPSVSANLTFKSPSDWGYYFGDWNLSILPNWTHGSQFNFNPRSVEGVQNDFYWPDSWMIDLKISKTFDLAFTKATFYIDVNNLLNRKVFLFNYAFSDGIGGTDYTNYMKSLHLPEYSAPYYDSIRDEANGYYVSGDDKIGDLRSADKPYINDPNNDMFTYGFPREIWFGIRFDF